MTDKELRKLSRLELLELLLEASKENERLRDELKALEADNEAAQKIRDLTEVASQLENALRYANGLAEALRSAPYKPDGASGGNISHGKTDSPSDGDIYGRVMAFYSKNPEALQLLPEKLRNDVSKRIKNVLERIKK